MKEIEAKVKINEFSDDNLELIKEVRVYDVYFDNGELHVNDKVLRLRKENDESFIAFKGPREKHDDLIVREEIEPSISSFEEGVKIVRALGYEEVAKVEKIRTYFKTKEYPSLSITVDKYPYIGKYLEVEGEEKEVYAFLEKHNLKQTIKKNCTEIFLEYCKENNLEFEKPELHFVFSH